MRTQGDNHLSSTIPMSWLRVGPFPRLMTLGLALNQLAGTIPSPEPGCALCRLDVSDPLLRQNKALHVSCALQELRLFLKSTLAFLTCWFLNIPCCENFIPF